MMCERKVETGRLMFVLTLVASLVPIVFGTWYELTACPAYIAGSTEA